MLSRALRNIKIAEQFFCTNLYQSFTPEAVHYYLSHFLLTTYFLIGQYMLDPFVINQNLPQIFKSKDVWTIGPSAFCRVVLDSHIVLIKLNSLYPSLESSNLIGPWVSFSIYRPLFRNTKVALTVNYQRVNPGQQKSFSAHVMINCNLIGCTLSPLTSTTMLAHFDLKPSDLGHHSSPPLMTNGNA